MTTAATFAAFEQLGLIREHLTRLQDLAADIEDPTLSLLVGRAMHTNTLALTHTNDLMHRTTTDPAEPTLDSQKLGRVR